MTKTHIPAVVAESFDFLVDANMRLVGIEVEPKNDADTFILPMSYETAEKMAFNILKLLLFNAPEMAEARLTGR